VIQGMGKASLLER